MQSTVIVGIVLSAAILCLALIVATILAVIRLAQGGLSRKSREARSEEARMVQEMYRGLSRMEERVSALETILMDKQRKDNER